MSGNNHPRSSAMNGALVAVGSIVALLLAFLAGRSLAPSEIVTVPSASPVPSPVVEVQVQTPPACRRLIDTADDLNAAHEAYEATFIEMLRIWSSDDVPDPDIYIPRLDSHVERIDELQPEYERLSTQCDRAT